MGCYCFWTVFFFIRSSRHCGGATLATIKKSWIDVQVVVLEADESGERTSSERSKKRDKYIEMNQKGETTCHVMAHRSEV